MYYGEQGAFVSSRVDNRRTWHKAVGVYVDRSLVFDIVFYWYRATFRNDLELSDKLSLAGIKVARAVGGEVKVVYTLIKPEQRCP